jgi:hypothetical protein
MQRYKNKGSEAIRRDMLDPPSSQAYERADDRSVFRWGCRCICNDIASSRRRPELGLSDPVEVVQGVIAERTETVIDFHEQ